MYMYMSVENDMHTAERTYHRLVMICRRKQLDE